MKKELSELYVFSKTFPEEVKNEMLTRFEDYVDEMRQIAEKHHLGEVFFYMDPRTLPSFGDSDDGSAGTVCSAIVYHTDDSVNRAESAGVLHKLEIILERGQKEGQQQDLTIIHKQGFYPGSESEKSPLNSRKS